MLDLTTGAWSKPDVVGPSPSPRAGHGGVLVGDLWYILGGGNNVKGEHMDTPTRHKEYACVLSTQPWQEDACA